MNVTMTHRTDRGRVRTGNEDAVYCGADPSGRRGALMVLADGLGGANAGEVASRLAVESVVENYFASAHPPGAALRDALGEANRRVFAAAQAPETNGMGTTCSALVLAGNHASVAHVGDSRIYVLREGELQRLTRAHSLWAEQVSRNAVSPAVRVGQNVLTRVLGVPEDIEVDLTPALEVRHGDRFVLCSDGLWSVVTDPEIADTLHRGTLETACHELVDLANARGGPDNVSVILAHVERTGAA